MCLRDEGLQPLSTFSGFQATQAWKISPAAALSLYVPGTSRNLHFCRWSPGDLLPFAERHKLTKVGGPPWYCKTNIGHCFCNLWWFSFENSYRDKAAGLPRSSCHFPTWYSHGGENPIPSPRYKVLSLWGRRVVEKGTRAKPAWHSSAMPSPAAIKQTWNRILLFLPKLPSNLFLSLIAKTVIRSLYTQPFNVWYELL